MTNLSYILKLNSGFRGAQRLGFTYTSQAFAKIIDSESMPEYEDLSKELELTNNANLRSHTDNDS